MSDRKARPRLTDLPDRSPASAKRGVVFSWVLLFWTSKREVPRPPKEDESFSIDAAKCGEGVAHEAHSDDGYTGLSKQTLSGRGGDFGCLVSLRRPGRAGPAEIEPEGI
jgi:hypothetical protein